MANEAYRAVFLRVHPTGKMVLSLTTDADTLAWSWGCVTLTPSLTVTVRRMVVRVLLSAWVCAGKPRDRTIRGYLVRENPWLQLQGRQHGVAP